jgi:uncharacterized membrane protein
MVAPTTWMFGHPYVVSGTVQHGATVVAINVGGALIPALVSIYLFLRLGMRWRILLIGADLLNLGRVAEMAPTS